MLRTVKRANGVGGGPHKKAGEIGRRLTTDHTSIVGSYLGRNGECIAERYGHPKPGEEKKG